MMVVFHTPPDHFYGWLGNKKGSVKTETNKETAEYMARRGSDEPCILNGSMYVRPIKTSTVQMNGCASKWDHAERAASLWSWFKTHSANWRFNKPVVE